MDKEKKDFLLSLNESEAAKLSLSERHDRIRLLRQRIANEMVSELSRRYIPSLQEKTSPRASNAPTDVKKYWHKD